jgi:hypothetical protein
LRFIGKVELPKSVVPYNSTCIFPAFGSQYHNCL